MSGVASSLGNPLHTADAPAEPERLIILDTTLRDGEQSPGVALSADDKLAIARQLARLQVDVIEAGFPFSSPGDHAAVRAIAEQIDGPVIAGLSRCFEKDVRQCAEALEPAARARIHVFIGTSPVHRDSQLHMSQQQVLDRVVSMTALAATFRDDVEFSPMDASRTEPEYLAEVVAAAITAGATTINLPDTVGYATPDEWRGLIDWLRGCVPALDSVTLSVHCHNDLGLAVANSLASVRAGARQVETCVNGIGERAGNAALEEVAMATRLHPEVFGVATRLDHSQLFRTSRLVSQLTGMLVQPNKAVVGANAFAHHSGIHQDGVLKDRRTFEIMDAAEVGAGSTLVLGKLSGRHALRSRLEELGYRLADEELKRAFVRFQEFALQAITAGVDAVGEVSVRLRRDGVRASGHGADTDIIVAAAKAYVHAINRMAERVASGDRPTPETVGAGVAGDAR